jgi:hypothetical protein
VCECWLSCRITAISESDRLWHSSVLSFRYTDFSLADGYEIRLTIRYGNDSTMIWEQDDYSLRFMQIGEFMKKVALRQ